MVENNNWESVCMYSLFFPLSQGTVYLSGIIVQT